MVDIVWVSFMQFRLCCMCNCGFMNDESWGADTLKLLDFFFALAISSKTYNYLEHVDKHNDKDNHPILCLPQIWLFRSEMIFSLFDARENEWKSRRQCLYVCREFSVRLIIHLNKTHSQISIFVQAFFFLWRSKYKRRMGKIYLKYQLISCFRCCFMSIQQTLNSATIIR